MRRNIKLEFPQVPNDCVEVYYSVSADRLLRKETTVYLPYRLDSLMGSFQYTTFDNSHFQLKWKELFKTYDLPYNAALECRGLSIDTYDVLVPIPSIEELSVPDDPPILTKTIQFYHDGNSFGYSSNNPAIVTYYYGTRVLCSFDVYYEFVQPLNEVEKLAKLSVVDQEEKEQLMDYWLMGGDIYSNPEDIRDFTNKPYDYINYLRTNMGNYASWSSTGFSGIPGNVHGISSPTLIDNGGYDDDDDDVLPF